MAKPEIIAAPPLELTVQGDIGGGVIIALVAREELMLQGRLDETLDRMTRAWNRQRAISNLRTLMLELEKTKLAISALPERKQSVALGRAADRARLIAKWEQEHFLSQKRAAFKMTSQQEAALRAHDTETQQKLDEADRERADADRMLPFLEEQIEKLRAQIGGDDPVYLEAEDLREAAE